MPRTARSLVTGFAITAWLWPAPAAQAQDAAPATVEQVRGSFVSAGFQVDRAYDWSWTSPPVSTVQVHDPARGRVLMALVYRDSGMLLDPSVVREPSPPDIAVDADAELALDNSAASL